MRELLKIFPDTPLMGAGENTEVDSIEKLKKRYALIKVYIDRRLEEFGKIYAEGDEKRLFAELSFCILTPQSNARYCWESICNLYETDVLFEGGRDRIFDMLKKVRFKSKKAEYIIELREKLYNKKTGIKRMIEEFKNPFAAREWFVRNIKGLGYKEASHFLRNLGLGRKIAILDRHILRSLVKYGVIGEIPKSLSRKKYLDIEKAFSLFAERVNIPLDHLDLLFWFNAKGEIFK